MTHTCRNKITPFIAAMLLVTCLAPTPANGASGIRTILSNVETKMGPKQRAAAAAATLYVVWRLAYKQETDSNDEAVKTRALNDAKWLKNNVTGAYKPSYFKRLLAASWHILDNVIIGSPGKKRGLKIWGTKAVADDVNGEVTIGSNGQVIEVTRHPDNQPYGLIGKLWAYHLQPVVYFWKDIESLDKGVGLVGDMFS